MAMRVASLRIVVQKRVCGQATYTLACNSALADEYDWRLSQVGRVKVRGEQKITPLELIRVMRNMGCTTFCIDRGQYRWRGRRIVMVARFFGGDFS
jgi:hypothetical protein